MPKPNFFIVGAPKCGTTSMYEYLRPHPEVFMSPRKEPHYFAADLQWQWDWPIFDEEKYLALFKDAGDAKRIGEASVWYLYSQEAAKRIRAFAPEARIIAMLRNPIDMIYSLFWHSVRNGSEDLTDFAAALDAEEDRRQGRHIPKGAPLIDALFYRRVPLYTQQVQRYFDVFGRENVLIIIFDDLKANAPGIYREVVDFLGISRSGMPEFVIANPAGELPKSPFIKFLKTHRRFHRVAQAITPLSWRRKAGVIFRRFRPPGPPQPPLDSAVRAGLQDHFAHEVERLSALLGRDLTHWSRPQPERASESSKVGG